MSKGPATAVDETQALGATTIASSAVITGAIRLGDGALLAEGAVIRSAQLAVELAARGGACTHRPCPLAPRSEHGPRCRREKCDCPVFRHKGACADWTPCDDQPLPPQRPAVGCPRGTRGVSSLQSREVPR